MMAWRVGQDRCYSFYRLKLNVRGFRVRSSGQIRLGPFDRVRHAVVGLRCFLEGSSLGYSGIPKSEPGRLHKVTSEPLKATSCILTPQR